MKGLIFLAHGSKVAETQDTLQQYIDVLSDRLNYDQILGAYLQMMNPNLLEAIEALVSKGVQNIDIFPFLLFNGNHMLSDIPVKIELARKNHPELQIRFLDCIGFDEAVVELIIRRLQAS